MVKPPIWHIETRKISSLIPYFKNPRILTKAQEEHLATSLKKFGLIDRPCINANGTIIGGHQRINILKDYPEKEIEVMVPDRILDNAEIEELNIRLNKNTGEWDWDCLANEWEAEDLIAWGFDSHELGMLPPDASGNIADDEEVMSPPANPISKKGDLIELNHHRLLCGDSTDPACVAKLFEDIEQLPLLMVTDPPYGVDYDQEFRNKAKIRHGKNKAKGKVANDEQVDWQAAWELSPSKVAYIWHAGKFSSQVQKSLEIVGFEIISQIIWAKQHFALSRGDYHWQHEPCWYAVREGCDHNWQGSRKESTLWEISNLNAFGKNNEEERTAHGTQKPIECMARPMRNNSAIGDGVYDPFLGSGSTIIAAQDLDRICYGIEIDPAYCDIVIQRWINCMKLNGKEYCVKRNGNIENI